jgi:hypothetical protein
MKKFNSTISIHNAKLYNLLFNAMLPISEGNYLDHAIGAHGGVPQSENNHPNSYHIMFFHNSRVLKKITEIQFIT